MSKCSEQIASFVGRAVLILLSISVGVTFSQVSGMTQFGNRTEGITARLNASEDLSFLAFHHYFQPFSRSVGLHVRFFTPQKPPIETSKLVVEALELQDSLHYYMVSRDMNSNTYSNPIVFEPWPTSDVIDKLGLASSNIGVRASYRARGGSRFYVPVDVYTTQDKFVAQTYTLFFLTSQDLQSVDVSISDSSGKFLRTKTPNPACDETQNPNCILFPAGTTQALDIDLSPLSTGEYHFHLAGHVPRTSETTSLEVPFYYDSRLSSALGSQ